MTGWRPLLAAALLAGAATAPVGIERRFREADLHLRSGSLLRARKEIDALERESRLRADPAFRARALRESGRVLDALGSEDEARRRFEEGLALAGGDTPLAASILEAMGFAAWRRADYDAASDLARRSRSLPLLGKIAHKRGEYDQALRLLGEALRLAKGDGDLLARADAHQALGEVHLDLRSFRSADAAFEARLDLVRRLGLPTEESHALGYRGILRRFEGDLDDALDFHDRALAVAVASGDEGARSHALQARASVLRDLGRSDEALRDLKEAIRLREAAGDARSRAWSLASLGRLEKERERYRPALEAYREALSAFERLRERRALAWHRLETARLHVLLGERSLARAAYERTLAEMAAVRLPYEAIALGEYGLLLAEEGDPARALEFGRGARRHAEATGNAAMRVLAAHALGRILARLGRLEEALPPLRESIETIESMRAELLPSDGAKSGFFEGRQAVYEDTASVLVDLGRHDEALEIAERARTRAFLDLLGSRDGTRQADPPAPGPVPQREPQGASEDPPDRRPPGTFRGGSSPASPAAASSPVRPSLPSPGSTAPPSLEAIREEARVRRTPIVEYLTTERRVLAWMVTPDGQVHASATPIDRQALRRDAIDARSPEDGAVARRRLYRALLAPFESWLPSQAGATVIVVPHGPLFRVSFAGLEAPGGVFLAERLAISYAPSVGVLRTLRGRAKPPAGGPALVIGNPAMPAPRHGDPALPPLPGAEVEAAAVGRAWPEASVLVGRQATERAVRLAGPRTAVLHLATHGIVRDDAPFDSAVVLAPSPGGGPDADGFLTVDEVFGLELAGGLVVLSACDTGLGRISGDGVMGLSRAFLFAGSRRVVATLWRVADGVASREMEVLHRELRAGAPGPEALRRAQVSTLAELRSGAILTPSGKRVPPDPAYWAAFVLIGD